MSRIYPAGQAANAEFAFHTWLTLYMQAYTKAKPKLRAMGLLEDARSSTKKYHITLPPVALGKEVEEIDGNEWVTSGIQLAEITGTCVKQGPMGLHFTEEDLLEDKIPAANARSEALARAAAYFEDRKGTKALENGVTTTTGHDNKLIFATDHPIDPVAGGSTQSNKHTLALTTDNCHDVANHFVTFQAENGDPFYGDIDSELELALIVPSALKSTGEKILDRQFIGEAGAGVSNVAYKIAEMVVLPRLTDNLRWYMAVRNLPRKLITRVVFMERVRRMLGPGSDLWESKQIMKIFEYERTDYRISDYRLVQTSKPV